MIKQFYAANGGIHWQFFSWKMDRRVKSICKYYKICYNIFVTYTKHTLAALLIGSSLTLSAVSSRSAASIEAPVASAQTTNDSALRVAKRLQARIHRRFKKNLSLSTLAAAVEYRRDLFSRNLLVAFQDRDSGVQIATWNVSLGQHPEWMRFDLGTTALFSLDAGVMNDQLLHELPEGLNAPTFAVVTATHAEGTIQRATMEGTPSDGQRIDTTALVQDVLQALEQRQPVVVHDVESVEGAVLYNDGTTTHVLKQLGTGRSEFASSPWGRKQNVRKAMNEKTNGVLIPQGATFSFNATLGGPITHGNGWYDSLIIVNGRDLEPAPGGGICQSATTVYRAAMAAGLPIAKRKSHSLYVTYYKQYGVGMDATVFPGKQDLTFENDTPGPVMLLGSTDEHDNAYSSLYGIDDGRTVALEGPYFGYTHKSAVMGRTLRSNEVAWIQRVTRSDGSVREQLQVAQYSGLPKSVAFEFEPVLHGAGDLVAEVR